MTPSSAPDAGPTRLPTGRPATPALGGALQRLPWPLPAVLAWAVGWLVALSCRLAGLPAGAGLLAGTAVAVLLAWHNPGAWRRGIAASGFPASYLLLAGFGQAMQASAWLLALAPLLLLYPLRAWRDAPFFPTPAAALHGLGEVIRPAPTSVLDAGCGLGHGLAALRRVWPGSSLHGVEWSWPMAWICRRRLPGAEIRRGDMWARSWSGFDLVYLFQRPETMPRAWAKACSEMGEGAWLASLEFPVPGVEPVATVDAGVGRPVHIYRMRHAAGSGPRERSTGAATGR